MADAIDDSEMLDDDRALTIEAAEVIREISYAVNFVEISNVLPATTNLVYINLTTKENQNMCVELSLSGFRVGHNVLIINKLSFSMDAAPTFVARSESVKKDRPGCPHMNPDLLLLSGMDPSVKHRGPGDPFGSFEAYVVSLEYNKINPEYISRHYETIYSLLDSCSAEYRSTFCETLSLKLQSLQRQGLYTDEDTSDDQMDTK